MTIHELLANYLWFLILPLWLLAGLGDWFCHRASGIERTAGTRESLLHSLMLAEMGIPVLAALFMEINAAIFLLFIAAFALHEMTSLWDVRYAQSQRYIAPVEQHLHSFLELMPLFALLLLSILHWQQFAALLPFDEHTADFRLQLKREPLPASHIGALLAAIVILQILPYAEELWRCHRAAQSSMNRGA